MATRIVSDWQGNVISRDGKRVDDDDIEEKLTKAAYKAVTPATTPAASAQTVKPGYTVAPGSTVGRPTNFAGDDEAYLRSIANEPAIKAANIAYNTGSGGRFDQIASGYDPGGRASPAGRGNTTGSSFTPTVSQPYQQAYKQSKKAQEAALEAALSAIGAQRPVIQNQYEDLAKQAYASYMRGNTAMPYQTQNLATGSQDNLALQQQLGYENTRSDISQNKAQALLALESQIAQARATGAANLAELEGQYATLQAQLLKESQDMAYDQQWRMEERAYNQQMQQEERDYNRQQTELAYQRKAASGGGGSSGGAGAPAPSNTVPRTYSEAVTVANSSNSFAPIAAYYRSLGYSEEYIAQLINNAISDQESAFYGWKVR